MNNLLQKSIVIAILIIAVSVGYYFVIFLPNERKESARQSETQAFIENERKCQEAGRALHKIDAGDSGSAQSEAKFKFDKESNRCLYKGGFIQKDQIHEYIKNVYTNGTVTEYISLNKNGELIEIYGNKDGFDRISKQYFGE